MGGVRRLFGQISRRAFFGLLAVTLIASQLAFMAPVFALDSTLSGTVTASASNTPINNALVEVLDETGLPVGAANTNSAGFYSISVLAGTYDVRVTPPAGSGLRVSTVNDIDLSTSKIQNFILVQQSEFLYAGTLVDKNGDPLSDWTFRLLTLGGSKADETTTDTLGRFSLSVPANDYLVETTSVSSGQVKSLNRAVTVSSDMANQTLTINKVSFTINVVDTDGNPVSGINAFMNEIFEPTIQLLPNHRTRGLVQQSKTTSGNSVTFDIFPATTNRGNGLSISTTTPGFGDMLIYPFPPVTEDTTITVVMSRKFTYSGVLVDQNGDPMANQTVQALRLNGSRTGEDQTDELGRFGMSIPAGDHMLQVPGNTALGGSVRSLAKAFTINDDMTDQVLTINRVKLTYNFVDKNGDPVNGVSGSFGAIFEPTIQFLPSHPTRGVIGINKSTEGSSLTFDVFPATTSRNVSIGFKSPGYAERRFGQLPPITEDMIITVVMEGSLTYSGTLVDQNGDPIKNELVSLRASSGSLNGEDTTDDLGRFSMLVGPGEQFFRVGNTDNPGSITSLNAAFNMTADMTDQILTVNTAKLNINVVDQDGNPVNGINAFMNEIWDSTFQLLPNHPTRGVVQTNRTTSGNSVAFDIYSSSTKPRGSLNITTTQPGYVDVLIDNLQAFSSDTTITVVMQQVTLPDVPQNSSAISPTNQLPVLSWNAVASATTYKIFRDGMEIGTTTETNFTDNSLTISSTFNYTVSACNEFGCSDQSSPVAVVYDTEAPMLDDPIWSVNPQTEGLDTTLTVPVSDALSGVTQGEYFIGEDPGEGNAVAMNLDLIGLTAMFGAGLEPGTYTVGVRAKDNAGSWSAVTTTDLVIEPLDTTPPEITPDLPAPDGDNGWYVLPVVLSWNVTDPESQIVDQDGCDAVTHDTDTTGTDYICSATTAGGTASETVTIKYDATAPVTGAPVWSTNPKAVTQTANLTVPATDTTSGVAGGEYFIGDADPGEGNGATTGWDGTNLTTTFGTDFPTGVYRINVRVVDNAGNWSDVVTDYLVVYDTGFRMTGRRTIIPSLTNGDTLPGLIDFGQTDKARFGFNVRYNNQGEIHQNSDFQFRYETGSHCNGNNPENCHEFDLDATSITWFATQGTNSSEGVFQGTAELEVDGVNSSVVFRVSGLDGERLSPTNQDHFTLLIYAEGADPNIATPIYRVSADVDRGNIKIVN